MNARLRRLPGQAILYAALGAVIGYLSSAPVYVHVPPQTAVLTLSFSHAGQRVTPCRRLTPEEIAALAANMRRTEQCPRGRVDLLVELSLDGAPLFRASLPPSGIAGDGASTAFERFLLAPGRHRLQARLRDSRRAAGYDYELDETIELDSGRNIVLDFRADTGGFKLL